MLKLLQMYLAINVIWTPNSPFEDWVPENQFSMDVDLIKENYLPNFKFVGFKLWKTIFIHLNF